MNVYLAEFIGTAILIYFGAGVNAGLSLTGSYAKDSGWIVISLAWGFAVAFAIYAVGAISGAHVNPAVTFGLAMSGDFPWQKVPGYMGSQVGGAMFGALLVWLQYLPHWSKTEEKDAKLGIFCTSPAIPSTFSNLLSEVMGTFILVFALMFIGANEFSNGLNPLVVGGLIVAIGMSMGGTTGYAINPARDFGPRLAHFLLPISGKGGSNWGYSWIPIIGPILGGGLGSLTYLAVFKGQLTASFWIILSLTLIVIALAIKEQRKK